MTNKDLILKEWNLDGVSSPSYVLHTGLLEANLAKGTSELHQFCNGPLFGEDTKKILDEVCGK